MLTDCDTCTAPSSFRSSTAPTPTLLSKTSRPSCRLDLSTRIFSARPSRATRVPLQSLLPLAAPREIHPRRTKWSGRARCPSRRRFNLVQEIDPSVGRLAACVARRVGESFPRHQQHPTVPPMVLCPRGAWVVRRTSRRRKHLCVANRSFARQLLLCRSRPAHRVRAVRSRPERPHRADTIRRAAFEPA